MTEKQIESEKNTAKNGTKERIFNIATMLFAEYGYHATTTRMIANEAGADVSNLHYHFGDKAALYTDIVEDMNSKIKCVHKEVEKKVKGKTLEFRLATAVDTVADFYFEYPEYAKLSYQINFSNIKMDNEKMQENEAFRKAQESSLKLIKDIAHFAFGMDKDKTNQNKTEILCIMGIAELLKLYVSGEESINKLMNLEREQYRKEVKQIVCRLFTLFGITQF